MKIVVIDVDILGVGSGEMDVDKAKDHELVYAMDFIEYIHYLH